jgi:3-hydroxyacyl-CoA dehydrogenase
MSDLAGLDISWRMRRSTGIKASAADAVFDSGRLGQKNGRGYFQYPNGARVGVEDPEVAEILQRVAEREGVTRRSIAQEEILRRLIYPMVNEGARILEEGIASRSSDIDVIWLHGYNWPRWRGGPMYFADETGLANVARDLELLAEGQGDPTLRPARLLAELAAEGRGFQSFAQA